MRETHRAEGFGPMVGQDQFAPHMAETHIFQIRWDFFSTETHDLEKEGKYKIFGANADICHCQKAFRFACSALTEVK